MSNRGSTSAPVHVLGAVHGVTPDGSVVDVPSASQRRLLGILAVHARTVAHGMARRCARRDHGSAQADGRAFAAIGPATLRTTSQGTRWRATSMRPP